MLSSLSRPASRWSLRSVWWLTGHPRFRPLYHRDVVSFDLAGQAQHLHQAGYHIAAAAVTRADLEARLRRLALLIPGFRDTRIQSVPGIAHYLVTSQVIDAKTRNKVITFWERASSMTHGRGVDAAKVGLLLVQARTIRDALQLATARVL